MSESVGKVAALWRFPVKSFLGEKVAEAEVTARGIVGDRGHALIDTSTGKVASAKNPRLWPDMFTCHAEYVERAARRRGTAARADHARRWHRRPQ